MYLVICNILATVVMRSGVIGYSHDLPTSAGTRCEHIYVYSKCLSHRGLSHNVQTYVVCTFNTLMYIRNRYSSVRLLFVTKNLIKNHNRYAIMLHIHPIKVNVNFFCGGYSTVITLLPLISEE